MSRFPSLVSPRCTIGSGAPYSSLHLGGASKPFRLDRREPGALAWPHRGRGRSGGGSWPGARVGAHAPRAAGGGCSGHDVRARGGRPRPIDPGELPRARTRARASVRTLGPVLHTRVRGRQRVGDPAEKRSGTSTIRSKSKPRAPADRDRACCAPLQCGSARPWLRKNALFRKTGSRCLRSLVASHSRTSSIRTPGRRSAPANAANTDWRVSSFKKSLRTPRQRMPSK